MAIVTHKTEECLRSTRIESPLGPLLAISDGEAVKLLEFDDNRRLSVQLAAMNRYDGRVVHEGTDAVLERLAEEIRRYFARTLREFTVPLASPGTPFQQAVWRELCGIPFGQTRSYASVAAAIGNPSAVRAVARANGANRIAIIIPCHRVIGSDGSMTGYGAGIPRKQWLLAHERGERVNGLWDVGT